MDNTEESIKLPDEQKNTEADVEIDKEETLASYFMAGVTPEEIEPIRAAQACSGLFTLLKELVRTQMPDFIVKLAMLLVLARDGSKTSWSPQELAKEFFWLQEGPRKRIIAQLSRSNWLIFSEGNYQLSTFGRGVLAVFTALAPQEKAPDALGANISSMTLMEMYQNDPTNTLRMFLNELVRIDEEVERTLESKSEYLIRKLNRRLRTQFEIAIKSREHLEHLPNDDFQSYRLKQQIHERLSSFHSRMSQVQRVQNDLVARKIILADKSLTHHDINTFLISASVEKLARLGRQFIACPLRIPDLIPPLMVYETEWQLEKNHDKKLKRAWSEVEDVAESKEDVMARSRFFQFMGEVEHTLSHKPEFTVEGFVPRDNWSTSALRFSMLAVMESGEMPESIQIGQDIPSLKIKVCYPEDSVDLPVAVIDDQFCGVKEITKGIVRPLTPTTPNNNKENDNGTA